VYQLRLPTEVLQTRITGSGLPGREFDVAVSRATFAPAEWLEIAERMVRSGGSVLVMTAGEEALPAKGQGPTALTREAVHEYRLPDGTPRMLTRYRKRST
jgi:16S rRNA G527 N7-methylase RsmG